MGCCGNNRAAPGPPGAATATRPGSATAGQAQQRVVAAVVHFQYMGGTALSARGMFSRRVYRFAAPLAVLEVDARDAPSMAAVPLLRRVKAPG